MWGAIARADITALLKKVLAPYPIPQPVAALAMQILQPDNLANWPKNGQIFFRVERPMPNGLPNCHLCGQFCRQILIIFYY